MRDPAIQLHTVHLVDGLQTYQSRDQDIVPLVDKKNQPKSLRENRCEPRTAHNPTTGVPNHTAHATRALVYPVDITRTCHPRDQDVRKSRPRKKSRKLSAAQKPTEDFPASSAQRLTTGPDTNPHIAGRTHSDPSTAQLIQTAMRRRKICVAQRPTEGSHSSPHATGRARSHLSTAQQIQKTTRTY